jgi:ArsR family transcriptional regulator, arsenate/arsenite/antimonite-responsive transcriptional repressor
MLNYSLSAKETERIVVLARAIGHPKRLAILDLLMQGVQCNCEISAQLGLADNLISHHMRALQESGLVQSERDPLDARWVYYSVVPGAIEEAGRLMGGLFDAARVQPRVAACGPRAAEGCC